MRRNSSFFWASDAMRNLDTDDDDFDDDADDDAVGRSSDELQPKQRLAPIVSQGTEDDNSTQEGLVLDDQLPAPLETFAADEESHPLILRTQEGDSGGGGGDYGSNSTSRQGVDVTIKGHQPQRRFMFTHRESHQSPHSFTDSWSKSPRQSLTLQQSMQPLVLRLQVVIWHVGQVDVRNGTVTMQFRVTLFWNDLATNDGTRVDAGNESLFEWEMKGRDRACRRDLNDELVKESVDVPPVSILNSVSFDTNGEAEVTMLDYETRLMRWTCMFSATLFQGDHFRVDQFPHDQHGLQVKIGILANRGPGGRWDKSFYKLALATEEDSQGSTKIPHGLIVEHVTVPDFTYNPNELSFAFVPLMFGTGKQAKERDRYLQVELPVYRLSGHYDRTIMPMLALLNIVAITCLPRNFNSASASAEIMLSIAFVQVGIRLTIDSRLPSVGYPIKMQRVLNKCFWLLCSLVLESNVVFFFVTKRGWKIAMTDRLDMMVACMGLSYTAYILVLYYGGRKSEHHSLSQR